MGQSATSDREDLALYSVAGLIRELTLAGRHTQVIGVDRAVYMGIGTSRVLSVWGDHFELSSGDVVECHALGMQGPWKILGEFLDQESGSWIFGQLGFGLHTYGLPRLPTDILPAAQLVVPQAVYRVDVSGVACVWGEQAPTFGEGLFEWRDLGESEVQEVNVVDHDSEDRCNFERSVQHVLSSIRANQIAKLTIARRVDLSGTGLDLPSSLQLAATNIDCRGKCSFYWSDSHLEFVGTSPEVTVQSAEDGTTFVSRAAGTWPSGGTSFDAGCDPNKMSEDRRVLGEHVLAAKALRNTLRREFQTIHEERSPQIARCVGVSHLLSTVKVGLLSRSKVARLLELVFPSGAVPEPDALRLLREIGEPPRGPYYGLIGFSAPHGECRWAHVLRSIFRTCQGTYAWTGAAVTALSTPAIEYEETRWKLGGILAGRLVGSCPRR